MIVTENRNFFLRNLWYYALPSNQLKPGAMMAKTLLGEPILLARRRTGQLFALRDICPHRAVPLSCGGFDGQEVECCYHGWRFDSSGHCTAIPSLVEGQDLDFRRFRVKQYPLREAQGNIWIYMAEDGTAEASPPECDIPLVPYFKDQSHHLAETVKFSCFMDHAVIGLIDPAHSSFVHRAWWHSGRSLYEETKQFDPSPYGFTMQRHQIENIPKAYWLVGGIPETEISFRLPSIRIEHITTSRHTLCNLTAVTPISETEVEVHFVAYWTMPWLTLLKPLLRPLVRAFLNEDREVVVKQQIGLKHNPNLMLIKDADTQVRWYYQLKTEFARATSEKRQFVNPIKGQVLRWRG